MAQLGRKRALQIIIISFLGSSSIWALDMLGSREGNCFPVKPVPLDMDWAVKQLFYYPKMSRANLYHIVAQMLTPVDPTTITEGSIYYDSCIRWQFFNSSFATLSGYGGTKETNDLLGLAPEVNGSTFWPNNGPGFNGTWWTTLTDSRTFVVIVVCSGDNEIMWSLLSTMSILPPLTIKHVTQHIIGMGFKHDYFTELKYDSCPKHQPLP